MITKDAGANGVGKVTELNDREPTIHDVRRGLRGRPMALNPFSAWAKVMYPVQVEDGWAMVVGHIANGEYEWAHVKCCGITHVDERGHVARLESEEEWTWSVEQYGSPTAALIAILLKLEGCQCSRCGCSVHADDVDLRCRHCQQSDRAQEG